MFDKKGYSINGQFKAFEHDQVELANRAFLYGDSIFETMFATSDDILFFDDHMNRLTNGMKVLKYNTPLLFTDYPDQLRTEILKLKQKNGCFRNARIRLTVYRKSGGFYTPESNDINYLIHAEKLNFDSYVLNKQGLKTEIYEEIRKPVNIFSPYKTAHSLLYTLSGIYNKTKSVDESYILNQKGHIIESTSSNIFTVYGDELFTPPVSEGCINGIMRKNIMRIAEDNSIKVTEKQINLEDLLSAEELFLTNTIKGVQWVVAFRQRRYYKKISEFLIGKLNRELF
jgi:branched-subunit amino acid aminotransferase/4-amino-4-deoxychorismate lyase